jgi:hypothetical protein
MRRFRQASILAQVDLNPSRIDLIERPQLCPGSAVYKSPASLFMQNPFSVSSTVQQTMYPEEPGSGLHLTLLPPSNAGVTAVTKVGFYFFGSVPAGLGNCLHHGSTGAASC